ncbi:MAG: TolC family protein [Acidobacteria bacterium]|nr:TolC family protein [Acidobacteriota bacterium]
MIWLTVLIVFQQHNWHWVQERMRDLPQLRQQQAHVAIAESIANQAAKAWSPQVSAEVNATSTNDPTAVFSGKLANGTFELRDFAIVSPTGFDTYPVNNPDAFSDLLLHIHANQKLYDGGSSHNLRQQAHWQYQSQQWMFRDHEQQAWLQLVRGLLEIDMLTNQLVAAKELLEHTELSLRRVEALAAEGQVPTVRVAQSQASQASMAARVIAIEALLTARTQALANWLDVSPSDIEHFPELPKVPDIQTTDIRYSEHVAQSILHASESGQKSILPKWKPKVNLNAVFTNHQGDQTHWWAGISASWHLMDRGASQARKGQASANVMLAQAHLETQQRSSKQARDVTQAMYAATQAEHRALSQAEQAASSSLQAQNAMLEEGQLDAGSLFEVRQNLLNLQQDRIATQARMDQLGWQLLDAHGIDIQSVLMKGNQP